MYKSIFAIKIVLIVLIFLYRVTQKIMDALCAMDKRMFSV